MNYTVAAVDEALGLLSLVAEQPGLGVTELAKRSGNTKMRAFRLLSTLEQRGFIERQGSSALYKLGYKTLLLGLAAQEQVHLVGQAQRHLNALGATFNESFGVRVRDGLESVAVASCESTHSLVVGAAMDRRRPLHAGSSGKVLLAFGPEEIRQAVLGGELQRFTPATIVQKSKLVQELAKIKAQGYATSRAEVAQDIVSVAAPVRDGTGEVIAALGLSVPATRAEPLARFIDAVVMSSAVLSRELGYGATEGLARG